VVKILGERPEILISFGLNALIIAPRTAIPTGSFMHVPARRLYSWPKNNNPPAILLHECCFPFAGEVLISRIVIAGDFFEK
jgi:hypothetical protein